MKQWDRSSFILVGYSFGAGVVPFIANNFPDQLKGKIKGVYCFSPDKTSDFEIHISDMLSMNTKEKYNVLNELKIIIPFNPVCIFGSKEDAKLKKQFFIKGIRIESLPGEHHYNNDYNAIAGIMLKDFLNGY
jgi:type IV secretory pathway VirJ component